MKSLNYELTLSYDMFLNNLHCSVISNLGVSHKFSCALTRVCHCDVYNVVWCTPTQHDFFKAAEDTDDENEEDEHPDEVEND